MIRKQCSLLLELYREVFMGANLNTNEKSLFIIDKPGWRNGAVATGIPNFAEDIILNPLVHSLEKDTNKNTWLVCPHLSRPDLVYGYYMASGLITVVLGKCFCDNCLDMILSKGDLTELLGSGRPMTDRLFQKNFISPLMDSNYNFTSTMGYSEHYDKSPKTWISCSHTATKENLKKAYVNGGSIFIFESFFTCQDCFEKIPSESLVDLLYEGESMTDALFQKRIVDSLYAINHESLDAVGHFDILQP
jgi:hypothetical protein